MTPTPEPSPGTVLGALDASKGSIVPRRLLPATTLASATAPSYLLVWCVAAAVGYGLPLLAVALSGQSLSSSTSSLDLPFLADLNVVCIGLVTVPCLLLLALRERRLLPACLEALASSGIVVFDRGKTAKSFRDDWEKRLRARNVLGSILGVLLGVSIAGLAYTQTVTGVHNEPPGHPIVQWQTFGAPAGSFNAAGWLFLGLQVLPLVFLLTTHLLRQLSITLLLHDLRSHTTVTVSLLHPDRLGGLRPIADLALHYHYAIAVLGLNLGFMRVTTLRLDRGMGPETLIAMLAYLILTPLALVAPLWPFRPAMIAAKHEALVNFNADFNGHLQRARSSAAADGAGSVSHLGSAEKLIILHKAIGGFPEWPFDWTTARKFWTTFLSPGYVVGIKMLWDALLR